MNIEVIILIVCAVVTLIVGLVLIPTVVLAPLGIIIIANSFMFAVMALQLYQSNESPVVTEGQVKQRIVNVPLFTLKRVNRVTEIWIVLYYNYGKFRTKSINALNLYEIKSRE